MADKPTKRRSSLPAKKRSGPPKRGEDRFEAPTQPTFSDVPRAKIASDTTEKRLAVATQAVIDRATLTVLTGLSAGQVYLLDEAETIVGRGLDATLVLEDSSISRHHAKLMDIGKGKYVLVDMGSTNGTFLRGRPITEANVFSGDRIQLGPNVVLRFSLTDETEESLQRRLYESSTRDTLTGVFNRKYFRERLLAEMAFARRHRTQVVVLMIDVDNFKRLNDAHGHPAGDEVLKGVASTILGQLRREDVLARFGGEEFAVLARAGSQLEALVLGERLRAAVERMRVRIGSRTITTTVSIGIARFNECSPSATDAELIAMADARLYQAKSAGRNRVIATG
jgi:diguanylate cyclase (GGDEF)-like protein